MDQIPWDKIRMDYVRTGTSLRKLADKYGVSCTSVYDHSKRYGWVAQRKERLRRVSEISMQKAAEADAAKLMRIGEAATKGLDAVLAAFDDADQLHRYVITEGIGGGATETTERRFDKVDTKALRDLTLALKELTGIMRDVYAIPTQAQAESQRIAAERLAMDQRKEEAGNSKEPVKLEIVGLPEDFGL